MRNKFLKTALAILWILTATGCSNVKHLPAGDRLFRGSKVFIHDRETDRKERGVLKTDLTGLVRPRPNTKFLGIRLKLSLYNLAGGDTKKKRGIKQWLRNKVGEPPVLLSAVHLDANKALMVN